ncbi:MAG: OmpA family protein [Lentimicrobiaceae bacterium]|nr:OmpA family protein [Lentimicrobiaceae bacterium]
MKSVYSKLFRYVAVFLAALMLGGVPVQAAAADNATVLPDNFGVLPKKEKENPTNKPVKAVKRPWELSEAQWEYANVGTPFTRSALSSVNGKTFRTAKRNYRIGLDLFRQARRVEATPYLLEAYKVNPDNLLLNVMLGHCHTVSTMTRWEAEPYLRKALEMDSGNYEARYDLARLYMSRYVLDTAIMLFEQCLHKPGLDTMAVDRCLQRIKECKFTQIQMKKPGRLFVDNLGITFNSPYPDYAPLVSADEEIIYFTSLRPGAVTEDVDPYSGLSYEDIYYAYRDSIVDTIWHVFNVGEPVNTKGHDATSGLAPDESTFYVYRGSKRQGEIFTAQADTVGWKKPKRQEESKETGTRISQEQSISFTFDGKTAYFASDREGGYGGFDIWMMHSNGDGTWGEPINLGPTVNTPKDEISPFVVADGKSIFFSSNGHQTMGGLDIFHSQKGETDTSWSEPKNLGWPINTVENDAFYRHSATGKTAYYASERMQESVGGYDLYMITYMGEEKGVVTQSEDQLIAYITKPVSESVSEAATEIQITPITLLKGFVYDDYSKDPLGADVVMVDNDLQEEIAVFKANPRTGRFMIQLPAGHNYAITVRRDGYLFHSENFDIPAISEYQEVYKEFLLKNVSVGSRVVLRNIFYEFDKATLLPQSYVELDRLYQLLEDVPTIKIEISGHTDNKGSASYNQGLSERRAKSVVDYLVARGISIDRLTFIGYGLAQPIATNDTEEGRALNRRTEFKIIENNMEEAPSSRRQPKQQIVVEPANPETPADAEAPANPETPEGTEGAGEQNPTE